MTATQKVLVIGAPSLTGKVANDLVNEHFTNAAYPLNITAKNLASYNMVFPEVSHHVFPSGAEFGVDLVMQDIDQLHRFVASVESVAELNFCESAIELTADGEADIELAPVGKPVVADQVGTEVVKAQKKTTTKDGA